MEPEVGSLVIYLYMKNLCHFIFVKYKIITGLRHIYDDL